MNTLSWVAFTTVLRREIVRIIRIWPQTLLPTPITMLLYFCIFGYVIGHRIESMSGVSYIQFLVPGLMMMGIVNNAFTNVASSLFSSKYARFIEEMLISPMPNWSILFGFVLGGVFRAVMVALAVFVVISCFLDIRMAHPWIVAYLCVMTAFLLSFGGFINGMLANKFDDVAIIPTFILTPLTYLGGVFYSIDLLPPFWQVISHFNPIFYMVNGFREAMIGLSDVSLYASVSVITGLTVLLGIAAYTMLRHRVGLKY
ncbi:MAG: ABC transporter permease [Legionellales bacterium]|nr:ABC transporter permease [Legionellales bacterium]